MAAVSDVTFAEHLPSRRSSSANSIKCCKCSCQPTGEFAKHFLTFSLLLLWLVGGMFVFYLVEHPAEVQRLHDAKQDLQTTTPAEVVSIIDITDLKMTDAIRLIFSQFVTSYELVNITNTTMVVKLLPNSALHNLSSTISGSNCDTPSEVPKWDLTGSMFFCITVVTTIGYGNYAPSTDPGRILCVVFATVGIPLTLIVVSNMGKLLTKFATKVADTVQEWTKQWREARSAPIDPSDLRQVFLARKRSRRQRKFAALVSALVISIFGIIVFLLLPGILFSYYERWDYVQALYYGYITLTTIGFGDLVAGQVPGENMELYRIFLCIWIFFGMAFIAMFISALQTMIDKMTKDSVEKIQTRISQVKMRQSKGSLDPSTAPNNYADEEAGRKSQRPSADELPRNSSINTRTPAEASDADTVLRIDSNSPSTTTSRPRDLSLNLQHDEDSIITAEVQQQQQQQQQQQPPASVESTKKRSHSVSSLGSTSSESDIEAL